MSKYKCKYHTLMFLIFNIIFTVKNVLRIIETVCPNKIICWKKVLIQICLSYIYFDIGYCWEENTQNQQAWQWQ